MAEKLTFTSVQLDKFGRNDKGVHADFSASLNSAVIQKMGWTEIPECLTGADLEGEITAISLELIPSDKELRKHAIELDLSKLHSFQTVRRELEGKKGKGYRTELRFKLSSQDVNGCRKLESYYLTANQKAQLTVAYEKAAVQEQLPGGEESIDTGCVACNNGIEIMPDNPKKHVTGARCTARPVQQEFTQ